MFKETCSLTKFPTKTLTARLTALCLTFLLLSGCGKPTVTWQGEVTLGGQPLPANAVEAVIQARPLDKNAALAVQTTIQNGKYVLKNVPKGAVLVQFIITVETGKTKTDSVYKTTYSEQKNIVPADKRKGIKMTADKNNSSLNFDL